MEIKKNIIIICEKIFIIFRGSDWLCQWKSKEIQISDFMHPDVVTLWCDRGGRYHIFVEWYLPFSNLKPKFSRLFKHSADILVLYFKLHSLLLLGGLLFKTKWAVWSYLTLKQGVHIPRYGMHRNYQQLFQKDFLQFA